MTFSFRVPFRVPPGQRILWTSGRIAVHSSATETVYLLSEADSAPGNLGLASIRGDGYPSEVEARAGGEDWSSWLALALVDLRIGLNLAETPDNAAAVSDDRLAAAQIAHPDSQVFRDRAGLFVFRTSPPALFLSPDPQARTDTHATEVVKRTLDARTQGVRFDDRTRRVSTLYALAAVLPSAEARFLTVMTAVEGLIQRRRRPDASQAVVDSLLEVLANAGLEQGERESLRSPVADLRYAAIGRSGKILAQRLSGSQYLGMSAAKFWAHVYTLRSNLAHGEESTVLRAKIVAATPDLEKFLSDVILQISLASERARERKPDSAPEPVNGPRRRGAVLIPSDAQR